MEPGAGTPDPFDDDLTRELPSALRTFKDLPALSPVVAEEIVELADEDVVFIVEHTAPLPRPASLPAFARDVRPAVASPWESPLVLVLWAALLSACMIAGAVGILLGRSLSATPRESRQPRLAEMGAARELLTLAPLSAPGKVTPAVVVLPPAPRSSGKTRALAPSSARRGHLGSDRR